MKTLFVNRNIIVSIFAVMLLVYGSQGVSYGQGEAPTVAPGETYTSLVVRFQITLDEGVDENAYQIQLRRKTPPGEWITKCVVIERGNPSEIAGDPDVSASAVWISGTRVFIFQAPGHYSDDTFDIEAIFRDLEPRTTYEARYRDTNLPECPQNPPAPDLLWTDVAVAEGLTYNVITEPGRGTNLYFTNDESIHRVSNDGTHRQNIVIGLYNPRGIVLDGVGGKIY